MSGIVLSASVRQNLLSLQSTAALLATTQNDLATGKKVNSALDNPTNYFTALSLDNRASDIGNLLDAIGNGVQVLQAANTGITSLQSLIDSAKSIANQALQTTVGYSQKSSVSATIPGATSTNLLGTTTYTSATATSNVLFSGASGGTTPATSALTLGGTVGTDTGTAITAGTTAAKGLNDTAANNGANAGVVAGDVITVDGHTITFEAGAPPASPPTGFTKVTSAAQATSGDVYTDGNGNTQIFLGTTGTANQATIGDVLTATDIASGVQGVNLSTGAATANAGQTASSVNGSGQVILNSSTGADLSVAGRADVLKALGLTTATGSGTAIVGAARKTSGASLGNLIQAGSTLNVDGHTITFANAPTPVAANVPAGSGVNGNVVTDGNGNSTVYLQSGTLGDVLNAIDLASGVQKATNTNGTAALTTTTGQTNSSVAPSGALNLSTGVNADLNITATGNALSALGLTGATGNSSTFTAARNAGPGGITGKTLTLTSFNGGTPVNITFGTGVGQVQSLNDLNTQLQADNLTATIDGTGKLTIQTTDDYASSTIGSATAGGVIGGTLTNAVTFSTASAPVADPAAQAVRANLVTQYNNILSQITTTAQDSSFNGVNLLNGDVLKLVFNETGTSTLNITGTNLNAAGLGLANLTTGVDFIDNNATNKVLNVLNVASSTLRSEASTLGSNLSIVEIRQDFNKNLINVLQTGSSNLTLADSNEEAANSQALSTRQSIAVSALALANQSQQSVLQLLR